MVKFIFLFLFFVCSYNLAISCECDNPSFEKSLADSAVVFSGTVAMMEQKDARFLVRFNPVHVWKGAPVREVRVLTEDNTARCGFPFESGGRYLVYATGDSKSLFVTACSRTRKEADAAEDLGQLVQRNNTAAQSQAKSGTLTVYYAVVMGISRRGSEYIALIKGADGRVYTMKTGDALYDGKIAKIDSNSVTFVKKSGKMVRKKLHVVPEVE